MKSFSKFFVLSFVFAVMSLITTACSINIATPPPKDFPFELMLSNDELPGWTQKYGEFEDVFGAVAYFVNFQPDSSTTWKFVSHQITVYPFRSDAQFAFDEWQTKWFRKGSHPETESSFIPQSPDDQFILEWSNWIINGQSLRGYSYLQCHENLIIFIIFNYDGQYLSLSQFDQILAQLDAKLQTYQPPN